MGDILKGSFLLKHKYDSSSFVVLSSMPLMTQIKTLPQTQTEYLGCLKSKNKERLLIYTVILVHSIYKIK